MLQILDTKGLQITFETSKHSMHTPVYKTGKYPMGSLGLLQVYVPQNIRKIYFLHKISKTHF